MNSIQGDGKGIRNVIILFSIFSLILLAVAWYASSLAPSLMLRNYRTVRYSAEMQSALTSIFLEATAGKLPQEAERHRFQINLDRQKENLTESGEPEITRLIEQQWRRFSDEPLSPSLETFQKLQSSLEKLKSINEASMYAYEDRALSIGKAVLAGGFLGFILVLTYSLQILLENDSLEASRPQSPASVSEAELTRRPFA